MDPAARINMRSLTKLVGPLLLAAACVGPSDEGPTPYDDEFPVSEDNVNVGAPDNDSLPDDNKADAQYPPKFELGDQSPVKSQGSRGVCSIFASTALVENLYIKAGMPVEQADFSEQYLQWASKKLQGAFPNTEGASSDSNLRTVVRFGTVKEADWPYESAPWTAANDPECTGGENLPTKCYTNGEPPAGVANALKYKLPATRWVNTNSMKAHLTTKKTGINVGMTFFYQSWNHRRSTLPVDAELWRRGIVTYPNAKDKEVSLEKRAGHAIQIIGWDDDLEVTMRDETGAPVKDAQGNERKEKGFWLFKNSWGTASFGADHPTGGGYGWISYKYVAEYGSAVTAELPQLAPAREVCDDAGMADEDGDGQRNCSDSDCASAPACSGQGTARSYSATPNQSIPDNSPAGLSSELSVTDTGTLSDVKLTVDITHTYRGDLKVTLVHGGTESIVFNGTGGSADDLKQTFSVPALVGKPLAGSWTLRVQDTAAQDLGVLNSWKLDTVAR